MLTGTHLFCKQEFGVRFPAGPPIGSKPDKAERRLTEDRFGLWGHVTASWGTAPPSWECDRVGEL